MHFFLLIAVTTALALCYAQNVGQAVVINKCNSIVWYSSVDYYQPPPTSINLDQQYSEPFRVNPGIYGNETGGISIKLGYDPNFENDSGFITQFEYTYVPASTMVYYDISDVNGNPFQSKGFILQGTSNECITVSCLPNENPCHDVYINSDDNGVVFGCQSNNTLALTLCPNPEDYSPEYCYMY